MFSHSCVSVSRLSLTDDLLISSHCAHWNIFLVINSPRSSTFSQNTCSWAFFKWNPARLQDSFSSSWWEQWLLILSWGRLQTPEGCFPAHYCYCFMLRFLFPWDHAIVTQGNTLPSAPSHCCHLLRTSAPCSQCFSQLLPISKTTSVSKKT